MYKINYNLENKIILHKNQNIFQSILWKQFQENYFKRKCYFFSIENDNNETVAICLIVVNNIKSGINYLYSPFGPILDYQNEEIFNLIRNEVEKIGKKENSVFYRIDPIITYNEISDNQLISFNKLYDLFIKKYKLKISFNQRQPENRYEIDLTQSEDQILQKMKPKGRYNIKIAQKHKINIIKTNKPDKNVLNQFYNLMKITTERDKFYLYNIEYFENLINIFNNCLSNSVYLYLAYYNDILVASAITTFFNEKSIYYYGCSANEYRNTMATYLLQWEMIKDAKKNNCKSYDFLGVTPDIFCENNKYYIFSGLNKKVFKNQQNGENYLKQHRYKGITDFKQKFGGKIIKYPGAFDQVYNKIGYKVLALLKKIYQG